MVTKLSVRGKNISVQLLPHIVRVTTDDQLTGLLQRNAEKRTEDLVRTIKAEYEKLYKVPFKVSDNSMVVEIWGHAYADRFAVWMKERIYFRLVQKATRFVILRAEVIDIGEREYDTNRFVWDGLAFAKRTIALFLPK